MVIVSQGKDTITNFNNVGILGIGDPREDSEGKFKMIVNTESDSYVIAKYETEERAREVLQEIMSAYKEGKFLCKVADNEWQKCNVVYEMPEK